MNDLISSKQLKILLSLNKLKSTFLYLSLLWNIITAISIPASAQITPDTTLDNSPSKVNSQNLNNLLIEGGVKNQSNLFHSFQEFNINKGQQVFFANPQGINNIITRITGNNPSNINGVLGVNGLANLFFINPNGIIFGKDARLDVNGSFIGSTADSINFSDGSFFSAIEPNNPALLKINVPLGLQYGNNPAAIQLKQANLQVKPGNILGLIGGNVNLDNTTLKAPGGTIQLGGLLSSGVVNLNDLKSFSFPDNIQLGDVSLINKSNIEVIASGGGDIFINANNFNLNNSSLQAGIKTGLGNQDAVAGDININTTGDINLNQNSNIKNILELDSVGEGGKIDIRTNNFFLKDSNILTDTESSGNAGNLTVKAENKFEIISSPTNIALRGEGRKGLSSITEDNATGNGGNIIVESPEITISGIGGIDSSTEGLGDGGTVNILTDRLNIIEGAAVLSNTEKSGDAGEIFIQASEFIEISNKLSDSRFESRRRPPGGIIADVRRGNREDGNGGTITLETARLTVKEGAFITTDTKGTGNGGNITIKATELVEVIGRGDNPNTQIVTEVRNNAAGKGGNLSIETKKLFVVNGARINVGTSGSGDSGNLHLKATESIILQGKSDDTPSSIIAQVGQDSNANGGNITIETKNLTIKDGNQISASNLGRGNSGNISIKATEAININGIFSTTESSDRLVAESSQDSNNFLIPSGIFSSSPGIGNAGDLNIETGKLTINNKSQISVSSQQQGAAGNLTIQGNQIYLDNSIISAETVAGDKGSIYFNGKDIRLRRGIQVTTNATQTATGGNIDIDTNTLVGLENSDITANAEDNFGGRVIINAEALFGIAFRDFLTLESDITATSALGAEFNGVVEINTPDIDPTSALEELPEGFTDSSQIQAGCAADGGNRFAETGRGGLPKTPQEVLRSQVVVEDWRVSAGEEIEKAEIQPKKDKFTPIVEARGWIVNQDGVVEFVTNLPQENIIYKNHSFNCG
ncbi:filamentous hemagglutinin family outer membrane protein [Calothrix parasitica NIES-267]|uniref:Filamentous hemagglutinin family outer membrane protein n=1 Tax=Calothrix parasitica NIES-267 TaxID=1973488 RepID=A0A1Z4LST7_9CYAN|nr:filamentous hemagglutinin family outer membrane protein [Calothrix parasitica NIES-267]